MIRTLFIFVFALISATCARAQLFDHTKVPVPLDHDLATDLVSVQSIGYLDTAPSLQDKSHLVKFECDDDRTLLIWFPNPDSWTARAKRESKQPVEAILQTKDSQRQAEVNPDSKLNQMIGKLIKTSIAKAKQEDQESIQYTLKCVMIRCPHAYFDSSFDD